MAFCKLNLNKFPERNIAPNYMCKILKYSVRRPDLINSDFISLETHIRFFGMCRLPEFSVQVEKENERDVTANI